MTEISPLPDKEAYRRKYPMPDLDTDIITLAHGSGGLMMHELLEKAVLRVLSNPWL
ncbi:MAG: hypothetical protein GXO27_04095, partial [Chlorobi bacterium]|nr:hypothetical protein [Chlorobiota bacterium]